MRSTKDERFVHLFVHHSFLLFFFQKNWYFNEKIDCERIQQKQRKGNDLNDLTSYEHFELFLKKSQENKQKYSHILTAETRCSTSFIGSLFLVYVTQSLTRPCSRRFFVPVVPNFKFEWDESKYVCQMFVAFVET